MREEILNNEDLELKTNNSVEQQIKDIITELQPFLINDGGNIEFVKYENGTVYIKMLGACADCGMLDLTLKDGIEAAIMSEVPEVSAVINIG